VQGDVVESERLLLSSVQNLRKSRGDHHHLTREAAIALVNFYQTRGRPAEAAPFEPLLKLPEIIDIGLDAPQTP
jgi:hypothetical protein